MHQEVTIWPCGDNIIWQSVTGIISKEWLWRPSVTVKSSAPLHKQITSSPPGQRNKITPTNEEKVTGQIERVNVTRNFTCKSCRTPFPDFNPDSFRQFFVIIKCLQCGDRVKISSLQPKIKVILTLHIAQMEKKFHLPSYLLKDIVKEISTIYNIYNIYISTISIYTQYLQINIHRRTWSSASETGWSHHNHWKRSNHKSWNCTAVPSQWWLNYSPYSQLRTACS